LLLQAYPGPQTELRDQLAVEAFIDSLDDSDLEIRVKDRFPKTLASAFQIAISLEANQLKPRKENDAKKEKTKAYRPEIEARKVNYSDNEPNQADLFMQKLETFQKNMERLTNERINEELREVKYKIQAIEVQSQNQRMNQQQQPVKLNNEKGATNYQNGWNQYQHTTDDNTQVKCNNDSERTPTRYGSQDVRDSRECFVCRSRDHLARSCPLVQCGDCGNFGHARGTCPSNPISTPHNTMRLPNLGSHDQGSNQIACYICQSRDHVVTYCPQAICGGCRNTGHTRRVCPNSNAPPGSNLRIARVYT
jgi:hypothetical protein